MAQNDGPVNAPYPTTWANETFCRPGYLCSRPGYLGVASLSRSSARTLSAFLESGSRTPSPGATLAPGMLDSPSPTSSPLLSRRGPLSLPARLNRDHFKPSVVAIVPIPLPAANCPTGPSGSPGASVNCRLVALSSIFAHVFSLLQQLMVSGASSQLRRHQTELATVSNPLAPLTLECVSPLRRRSPQMGQSNSITLCVGAHIEPYPRAEHGRCMFVPVIRTYQERAQSDQEYRLRVLFYDTLAWKLEVRVASIAIRGKRGRDLAMAMVSGLDAATQRHEVHGVHHRTSPCHVCTGRMMSERSCPVSSCGGLVRFRKVLSRPHTVLPGSSSCPRPEVLGTRHTGCAIPDEIAASVALGWGYVAAHLVRT
ncbi:hypothetical protein V8D89_007175 [Ganoderma adspersum]